MNSKVMIIAGMHRSGTSLISQWLFRCGLYIGKHLVPAGIGNTEGHFEDADFLQIHEQLLKKRKLPASGFTNKLTTALTMAEKQQLQFIIEDRCNNNIQWGWKEPRTCLFLNTYKEVIPAAYYLIVVRDYNATVSSMVSREYAAHIKRFQAKKGLTKIKWLLFKKKSREQVFKKYATRYLKIWIHYYECIMNHIISLPPQKYLLIKYSDLVEQDIKIFMHLKDEWKFSLDYFPFKNVFKKNLLSEVENINQYIRDKGLVERAKKIDRLIGQLLDS
jgi:hypothetical protein